MNERIRILRRSLGMTQQEFAKKIGSTQNILANYEIGRRSPSGSVVDNICKTFNVNEAWLRTGEGEMFISSPNSVLDALVREYSLSETSRIMIERFLRLKPAQMDAVLEYMKDVVSHLPDVDHKVIEPPQDELDIDAEVEEYRHQLELEKKQTAESEAFPDTVVRKNA